MQHQEVTYQYLGKGRKSIDGLEKITGRARYVGDLKLPGMLHARPLLSPYAHAEIVSVDTSAARAVPGVVDLAKAAEPDAPVIWPNGLPKEGMDMTAAHAAVDKDEETNQRAHSNIH